MFLNLTESVHRMPTENIMLNREKLYSFPLRLGNMKGFCSYDSFKIILEVLATAQS